MMMMMMMMMIMMIMINSPADLIGVWSDVEVVVVASSFGTAISGCE